MTTTVRSFEPNYSAHAINAGSVALVGTLASRFTQINLKSGLIFGACGELSSLVSLFAVRYITNNPIIQKAASLVARVGGGHFLGNIALQAAGFAPIAFGPATVAVQLLAPTATFAVEMLAPLAPIAITSASNNILIRVLNRILGF